MSLAQLDENVWILSEIYALNLLAQHELRMLEVGEFLRMALLFIVIHLKVPPTEGASKSVGKRNSNDLHIWITTIEEQMQKDKEADLFSFSKVIARCLKNYIDDGTKASEQTCANCGAEGTIIYQEGCQTCTACGFGACG